MSEDGSVRNKWYDEKDDKEENDTTTTGGDGDTTMTDSVKETVSTNDNNESCSNETENATTLEEGEIDEFGQFNDADFMSIDTEAFVKGTPKAGGNHVHLTSEKCNEEIS